MGDICLENFYEVVVFLIFLYSKNIMGYQPKDKSFEYYISVGFEYASGRKFTDSELILLRNISDIDTSIIKIDDILDNEQERNGSKCIYLIDGVENTIINARLDEINGLSALISLIEIRKLSPIFGYKILKIFNDNYIRGIYEGQKIDKELEKSSFITKETLDKYFLMVKKFTGGHIRYGLEIGQLLAGKDPDEKISLIGELLGINRQIVDDFQDYFTSHHYPFGDIKRSTKRLPEILFILNGGNRDVVLDAIEKKDFQKAVDTVLNKKVRNQLYTYCKENLARCRETKTDFEYQKIFIDCDLILTKKVFELHT